MTLDLLHNKIIKETLTESFEKSVNDNLVPKLYALYGTSLEGVQLYEDYINDDFIKDGYWYYPLTVIIGGIHAVLWIKWDISVSADFKDGVPYAYVGNGGIDFLLADDVPIAFKNSLEGRSNYFEGGYVKFGVSTDAPNPKILAGKYSQTFVDEMNRQISSAIGRACGVKGLPESSIELNIVFAPNTYMEHTSENVTYRRLLISSKGCSARDFWIKWTRKNSSVAFSVNDNVTADDIVFEIGEDVPQKIREKEYRFLVYGNSDKYRVAMGRKNVTEWRELIKRSVKRGELFKIADELEENAHVAAVSDKLSEILEKCGVSVPTVTSSDIRVDAEIANEALRLAVLGNGEAESENYVPEIPGAEAATDEADAFDEESTENDVTEKIFIQEEMVLGVDDNGSDEQDAAAEESIESEASDTEETEILDNEVEDAAEPENEQELETEEVELAEELVMTVGSEDTFDAMDSVFANLPEAEAGEFDFGKSEDSFANEIENVEELSFEDILEEFIPKSDDAENTDGFVNESEDESDSDLLGENEMNNEGFDFDYKLDESESVYDDINEDVEVEENFAEDESEALEAEENAFEDESEEVENEEITEATEEIEETTEATEEIEETAEATEENEETAEATEENEENSEDAEEGEAELPELEIEIYEDEDDTVEYGGIVFEEKSAEPEYDSEAVLKLENEIADLKHQLEIEKIERESVEAKLEEAIGLKNNVENDLSAERNNVSELEAKLRSAIIGKENAESQMNLELLAAAELRAQNEKQKFAIEQVKKLVEEETLARKEAEVELDVLKSEIENLKSENELLKSENKHLKDVARVSDEARREAEEMCKQHERELLNQMELMAKEKVREKNLFAEAARQAKEESEQRVAELREAEIARITEEARIEALRRAEDERLRLEDELRAVAQGSGGYYPQNPDQEEARKKSIEERARETRLRMEEKARLNAEAKASVSAEYRAPIVPVYENTAIEESVNSVESVAESNEFVIKSEAANAPIEENVVVATPAPVVNYTYTSYIVRLMFRRSADPNVTARIHEMISYALADFGKEHIYMKVKASMPDNYTVVLNFVKFPEEEFNLLVDIINYLGKSDLGVYKVVLD